MPRNPLLGLEGTQNITMDTAKLPDAPKALTKTKPAPRPASK